MVNKKLLPALLLFISTVASAQGFIPKLNVDNIQLDANTISTTNTNGNLSIDLNGSGQLRLPDLTATTVPYLDSNKGFVSSLVTPTELERLSGITSALCGVSQSCTLTNKTLTSPTINGPTIDVVNFDDQTTPSSPSSGFYKLYFKNDGQLYKLNSSGTEAQVGSGAGGGTGGINILQSYNFDAELGSTTSWTNSGGTFSTTTTAANVGFGNYSFSFDASSSGQYIESSSVTIPSGLYGNPCLLQFYAKGFDSNMTYEVTTGANTIASGTFSTTTEFRSYESTPFSCPSSGTLSAKFRSTADAAIGYLDNVHLGSAFNFSNMSIAQAAGSSYIATTTNCLASVTSTTIAQFGTDTDCPGPTIENAWIGSWQTTDADLPRQTINNLPPGRYKLEVTGGFNGGTGGRVAIALTDGTTTSAPCPVYGHNANIGNGSCVAWFDYSAAGNRTFEVRGSASSGTVQWINDTNNMALKFVLTRYPMTSEQAYKPSQVPFFWTGRHDATCTWSFGVTTLTSASGDATCAFVQDYNLNAGTVTSTNSGALTLTPGITFTPPDTEKYEVCADIVGSTTASLNYGFSIVDTTALTTTLDSIMGTSNGAHLMEGLGRVCAVGGVSSVGSSLSYLIRGISSTGVNNPVIGGSSTYTPNKSIRWTINRVAQRFNAPLIANSVTSPSSGVEQVMRARITNNGSACTAATNPGTWISSLNRNGNGRCGITIASGTFSSTPQCFCLPENSSSPAQCGADSSTTFSSTAYAFVTGNTAGTAADLSFNVFCMGAK